MNSLESVLASLFEATQAKHKELGLKPLDEKLYNIGGDDDNDDDNKN